MTTKYQIILIGNTHPRQKEIVDLFLGQVSTLGIDSKYVAMINSANFSTDYVGNAPAFCLYFGDENSNFKNEDILEKLLSDATLILPIVGNLTKFKDWIPEKLRSINGIELSASSNSIESIVNLILEGLGLLRITRRVFISYRRTESSQVAIQLYEQLEKNGFDVFLDTHSVKPGEPFQDELWHRMADTDVVVLLNTPGFLTSFWTQEELAKASAMQIGILQLIWPNHKMEVTASLTIPLQLEDSSFGNGKFVDDKSYLTTATVDEIVSHVEHLRARTLAARQDNLVTELMKAANKLGRATNLQPEKFIRTNRNNGDEVVLIPTVGVPEAFGYNQSEDRIKAMKLAKQPQVWLLFDHINIRDKWLKHLEWLDGHLPVRTLRIINAEAWLQNI